LQQGGESYTNKSNSTRLNTFKCSHI
ncbi:hypothetical protein D049_1452B, partial [Vibrio parahaemolyticus VPTS-2010]